MQRDANVAIEKVNNSAASSDQAITDAVRLQQNLIVSRNAAQGARDAASLAKQDADGQVSVSIMKHILVVSTIT